MTDPCCGLSVIFCGFISHLIGRETINIPEIFSGVHGFTGKTVNILHPKRQRNISLNQPSTHLNITQTVIECFKEGLRMVFLHARPSNFFNKMVRQMTILTVFGNLHISLK